MQEAAKSASLGCGLCAHHKFGLGVALTVPSGHEQNFLAEGIPKYVVDIGRAIDFKETRVAGVCPVQPRVEQNAQFGELLRLVRAQVFNHSRQACLYIFPL